MLEDFARYGLADAATDYGLILLAFTKRGLENMQLKLAGTTRVGAEDALVFSWRQTSTAGGELEFSGNQAVHRPLQGVLYARKSDGLPLRIQAWAEHRDANRTIRDQASVDYALSAHGFLTPASVVHRHLVDGRLRIENLYRYEPFKLFSADAEIRFTEAPEPHPPRPPQPEK
jgi:hypothetical protein